MSGWEEKKSRQTGDEVKGGDCKKGGKFNERKQSEMRGGKERHYLRN